METIRIRHRQRLTIMDVLTAPLLAQVARISFLATVGVGTSIFIFSI